MTYCVTIAIERPDLPARAVRPTLYIQHKNTLI